MNKKYWLGLFFGTLGFFVSVIYLGMFTSGGKETAMVIGAVLFPPFFILGYIFGSIIFTQIKLFFCGSKLRILHFKVISSALFVVVCAGQALVLWALSTGHIDELVNQFSRVELSYEGLTYVAEILYQYALISFKFGLLSMICGLCIGISFASKFFKNSVGFEIMSKYVFFAFISQLTVCIFAPFTLMFLIANILNLQFLLILVFEIIVLFSAVFTMKFVYDKFFINN